MNETMKTFGYPESLIKEFEHWVILIRPKQVTLGSMLLIEKSGAGHLGELSPQSWAEFSAVSAEAERLAKETFGAEKFNYLALMMKDPNVHFHFLPRYSLEKEFNGRKYVDKDWPVAPELKAIDLGNDELMKILEALKEGL